MVLRVKLTAAVLGIFFLPLLAASADGSAFPHGMPFPATRLLPASEETADAVTLQKEEASIQLVEGDYYRQNTRYTVACSKKPEKYRFRMLFFARNEKELFPDDVVIKVNGKVVQPLITTRKNEILDKDDVYMGYLNISQYYRYYTNISFDAMPDSGTGLIAIEVGYPDVTEDVTGLIRYGEPSVNEKVLPLVHWKNDPLFSLEIHNREQEDVEEDAWILNIRFPLKDTDGTDDDKIKEQENTLWLFADKNVLNNDLFKITKTEGNGLKFEFTKKFSGLYQQNFMMDSEGQGNQRENDEDYNSLKVVPPSDVIKSQTYTSPYLVNFNLYTEYKNNCYSDHKLNPYELILYTPRQLRYARNAFYAAHGYQFKSKDLQDFFEYTGHAPANPDFTESGFSDIENYNIKMIRQMEEFYNKE